MNITMQAPPTLTGDVKKDTENLNEWTRRFYSHLKRVLCCLDTSNIIELDSSRIVNSGESADA